MTAVYVGVVVGADVGRHVEVSSSCGFRITKGRRTTSDSRWLGRLHVYSAMAACVISLLPRSPSSRPTDAQRWSSTQGHRNAVAHPRTALDLVEQADELGERVLTTLREVPRQYFRVRRGLVQLYKDRSLTEKDGKTKRESDALELRTRGSSPSPSVQFSMARSVQLLPLTGSRRRSYLWRGQEKTAHLLPRAPTLRP